MKWVIWHMPGWAQRCIGWVTGYRVKRHVVGQHVAGYVWRRWPR